MLLDKLWKSKLVQGDSSLQLEMSIPPGEHAIHGIFWNSNRVFPSRLTITHLSVRPCTVLGRAADQVHIVLAWCMNHVRAIKMADSFDNEMKHKQRHEQQDNEGVLTPGVLQEWWRSV